MGIVIGLLVLGAVLAGIGALFGAGDPEPERRPEPPRPGPEQIRRARLRAEIARLEAERRKLAGTPGAPRAAPGPDAEYARALRRIDALPLPQDEKDDLKRRAERDRLREAERLG